MFTLLLALLHCIYQLAGHAAAENHTRRAVGVNQTKTMSRVIDNSLCLQLHTLICHINAINIKILTRATSSWKLKPNKLEILQIVRIDIEGETTTFKVSPASVQLCLD